MGTTEVVDGLTQKIGLAIEVAVHSNWHCRDGSNYFWLQVAQNLQRSTDELLRRKKENRANVY